MCLVSLRLVGHNDDWRGEAAPAPGSAHGFVAWLVISKRMSAPPLNKALKAIEEANLDAFYFFTLMERL